MRLNPLIPGTLALWQFQGDLLDTSGNGLHMAAVNNATEAPVATPPFNPVADRTAGVVTNDPCLIGVDLDAGSAVTKLMAPASPLLRLTGPLTFQWIMMWKFTFVWIQASVSSPSNYMFDVRASIFGGGTPAIYHPADGEQEFPSTTNANWARAGLPNIGDYHANYYTYTRDGSGHWTNYLNGVAIGAGVGSTAYVSNGTERFYLGGFAGQPGSQGCAGHFTSVRVLNYARTAAQVLSDAQAALGPCTASLAYRGVNIRLDTHK